MVGLLEILHVRKPRNVFANNATIVVTTRPTHREIWGMPSVPTVEPDTRPTHAEIWGLPTHTAGGRTAIGASNVYDSATPGSRIAEAEVVARLGNTAATRGTLDRPYRRSPADEADWQEFLMDQDN